MEENVRSVRDDCGPHKVGAVGLAGRQRSEAFSGACNLTSALITTTMALAGLESSSNASGDEGEKNGGFHFRDGLTRRMEVLLEYVRVGSQGVVWTLNWKTVNRPAERQEVKSSSSLEAIYENQIVRTNLDTVCTVCNTEDIFERRWEEGKLIGFMLCFWAVQPSR